MMRRTSSWRSICPKACRKWCRRASCAAHPIVRLASRTTTPQRASSLGAAATDSAANFDVSARYVESTLTHGANALAVAEHPVEMRTNAAPTPAPVMTKSELFRQRTSEAKLRGYVGIACTECQNFTMVRNGTCLKCDTCGSTSGCS